MTTISDSSFESALRAVLGECMREDGEWLTNSAPTNARVSRAADRKIRAAIRRDVRKDRQTPAIMFLRKSVVALASAMAVLFILAMTVQPVRAAFWNAIVKWYDTTIRLIFTTESPLPATLERVKHPDPIPGGWTLEGESVSASAASYDLTDGGNRFVFVLQSVANASSETWFEREDEVKVEKLKIRGNTDALLVVREDGTLSLTWTDEYYFILMGFGVDASFLVAVAEGLK